MVSPMPIGSVVSVTAAPEEAYFTEDGVLARGLRTLLGGPPDDGERAEKAA